MAKIDKEYNKLLSKIMYEGFKYEDPNRNGIQRLQIPNYTFKYEFKNGFPALTTKKLYWKGVVGELLWFLRGDTNIKYLVDNVINIWNKDAYNYYKNKLRETPKEDSYTEFIKWIKEKGTSYDLYGSLGKIYGKQWRGFGENDDTDQISNLIKGLKENPMGTKHIVTAWNPAELNEMALPPCHWSFEILVEPIESNIAYNNLEAVRIEPKIPEYQFTLKWHQRSVDTFLGLPFNIASYALLAQIIGKMTNMKPKGIIGDLSNVHIYEPHLDAVKEQLKRDIDKYSKSEISVHPEFEIATNAFNQGVLTLDEYLSEIRIDMFKLSGYESYPAIPAEMLAYNK